jgi:hypothetical protein
VDSNSDTAAVRCCADRNPGCGPPPPPAPLEDGFCTSAKSCTDLKELYTGWPTANGDINVCGESDNGFTAEGTNLCFGGSMEGGADTPHDGFSHGFTICNAMGARLCTVAELQVRSLARHPLCIIQSLP